MKKELYGKVIHIETNTDPPLGKIKCTDSHGNESIGLRTVCEHKLKRCMIEIKEYANAAIINQSTLYAVEECNIKQCCMTQLCKILEIKTWCYAKCTCAYTNMQRFQCKINGFVSNEWKLRLKAHRFSFPGLSAKIWEHRIADSTVELNSVRVICELIALTLVLWTYKI